MTSTTSIITKKPYFDDSSSNPFREVTRNDPCPICGHPDWCSTNEQFICCRRVDNGGVHKADKDGADYWLYRRDGQPIQSRAAQAADRDLPGFHTTERASDKICSRVYAKFISLLTLSPAHSKNLQDRGLTMEEIIKREYRTLPREGRAAIMRQMQKAFDPETLLSVPGFSINEKNGQRWLSFRGLPGILVPVRNKADLIVAFKIRLDEPGDGPKYIWWTSRHENKHGRQAGPSPGNPCHVPIYEGDTQIVRVTEGELKADIATVLSRTLTVSVPGVASYRQAIPVLKELSAKTVLLAFDADARANQNVAGALSRAARAYAKAGYEVKLETWNMEDGKGIDDLLAIGKKPNVIKGQAVGFAIQDILSAAEEAEDPSKASQAGGEDPEKLTVSQQLLQIAKDKAEFFRSPEGDVFATFPVTGHKETHPLNQRGFTGWLRHEYYKQTLGPDEPGKIPGSQSVHDVVKMLEAQTLLHGPEEPVFVRVGKYEGDVYMDLANDAWEAVKITSNGWEVVSDYPVKFRRAEGMLPLPRPKRGGNLERLRSFVNVGSDENWILLLSTLLAAFWPDGPFPVLCLLGREGCGKSIMIRVLRSLVDPAIGALRPPPREERDHAIAAGRSWILSYDNVSYIPGWFSDALCRTATGGGLATRRLYTDDEMQIFDYKRLVILTGITEVITRNDLLSRAILLDLAKIEPGERKDEKTLLAEFEQVRPGIFGALLDAVATGLKNLDSVRLEALPRMADFARWVVSCEPALPWKSGAFMAAYAEAQEEAVKRAVEADVIALAITELAAKYGTWEGTATELLVELEDFATEKVQKTKAWPKTPSHLSRQINRAATALENVGVNVKTGVNKSAKARRLIRVCQAEESEDDYEPF